MVDMVLTAAKVICVAKAALRFNERLWVSEFECANFWKHFAQHSTVYVERRDCGAGMSFVRGKIYHDREIIQNKLTFGKMPENIRQCDCGCEKWFDTSSGKAVEVKTSTLGELLDECSKPLCGRDAMETKP